MRLFASTFVHVWVSVTVRACVCVREGSVRLRAGVYLGGDGREILIDPLLSGPRGGTEQQNTWGKKKCS